jgi:hypothetical protein
VRKKGRRGKKKREKEKGKRKIKGKREGKRNRKNWENFGENKGKGEKYFGGIFRVFGCRRNFRDGADGEAGRPVGPRQARDSRQGGRQQRWGGTR